MRYNFPNHELQDLKVWILSQHHLFSVAYFQSVACNKRIWCDEKEKKKQQQIHIAVFHTHCTGSAILKFDLTSEIDIKRIFFIIWSSNKFFDFLTSKYNLIFSLKT